MSMIVQVWQVTVRLYLKSNMTFIVSTENFEHIGFHLRSNRVINWMGERGNVSEKYRGNTSTTVRRHQYQYWDIDIDMKSNIDIQTGSMKWRGNTPKTVWTLEKSILIKNNTKHRLIEIWTGNTWTAVKTHQYQYQDRVWKKYVLVDALLNWIW